MTMTASRTRVVLAIVVAMAAACRSKAADTPQRTATAAIGTVHSNPHFRITLPPGWRVTWSQPGPTEQLGVYSDGVVALKAVGPCGYHVEVWFECPGTEDSPDASWKVISDESGRGVSRIDETNAACTQESARKCEQEAAAGIGPDLCFCAVGDGKLEIWASFEGKHPFANTNGVCFQLGNDAREDADRAPLRDVLRTFRLEGAVDAPAPNLPPPSGVRDALR